MFWWQGNESADKWAKLGADDRNEAWGDLVDKILTGNLHKARAVVTWLGEGAWPDGRALGKCMGRCARSVGRGVAPNTVVARPALKGLILRASMGTIDTCAKRLGLMAFPLSIVPSAGVRERAKPGASRRAVGSCVGAMRPKRG